MDRQEIIKNNKIIADFMGLKELPDYTKDMGNPCYWYRGSIIEIGKYHLDWNWLMPVVEKCKENLEGLEVYFESEERRLFEEEIFNLDNTLSDFFNNDIEAIYRRCVRYIKWYNKNRNDEN